MSATAIRLVRELMERRLVVEPNGCWRWTGERGGFGGGGYGYVSVGGIKGRPAAHRLMYELEVGPIPEGFQVHHKCRNRLCVNPDHLEALPQDEHVRLHHARDVCKRGHPRTPENLKPNRTAGGASCRECERIMAEAYKPIKNARRRARRAAAKQL